MQKQEMRWLDEEVVVRRALGISIKSEAQVILIKALGNPLGKVLAVRVQDIPRNIWYNWDRGVGWTTNNPVGPGPGEGGVTPGSGTLYIAFYADNQSVAGNMRLTIVDDTGALLASKTAWANYGAGVGIEWTGNMPWRDYSITIEVTP